MRLDPKLRKAIVAFAYLADTQQKLAALRRLTDSPVAVQAWRALERRPLSEKPGASLHSAARDIGRALLVAHVGPHQRRTKTQIVAASKKAATLARELSRLIVHHDSLRFLIEQLYFEREQAAMDRVLRGVVFSGHSFSPEVERELDKLQQRDFGGALPTIDAYKFLNYHLGLSDLAFAARLEKFAELAEASRKSLPFVKQPNRPLAPVQYFAVMTCENLEYCFDTPQIEVATALAAAAFEEEGLDVNTVKKWWQRHCRGQKDRAPTNKRTRQRQTDVL